MSGRRRYVCSGYTLLFAIVVSVIVTATALLFLSYFNMNQYLLAGMKKQISGMDYGYQGLAWLAAADNPYDVPALLPCAEGHRMEVCKKQWGFYDIYHATVTMSDGDTLFSRIALVGNGKDTLFQPALYLRNTRASMYIADEVYIEGPCYVPSGVVKAHRAYYHNPDAWPDEVYASPDTLPRLRHVDRVKAWINDLPSFEKRIHVISDTTRHSFSDPTLVLSADTVMMHGYLSGNIIVRGDYVEVGADAGIEDIVVVGRTVRLPDYFRGRVQIIATDTIMVGHHNYFEYPSMLALLPRSKDNKRSSGNPVLYIGDSLTFFGELYAYMEDEKEGSSRRMTCTIEPGSRITGGIFTSGILEWQGSFRGNIFCEQIYGTNRGTIQANLIRAVSIDADLLPSFYVYSLPFPSGGAPKVVRWLEQKADPEHNVKI